MRLSPAGYAAMTSRLLTLSEGRVVLALEGGYNLDAISRSAAACLRVLLGEEAPASGPGGAPAEALRVSTPCSRLEDERPDGGIAPDREELSRAPQRQEIAIPAGERIARLPGRVDEPALEGLERSMTCR